MYVSRRLLPTLLPEGGQVIRETCACGSSTEIHSPGDWQASWENAAIAEWREKHYCSLKGKP